MIGSLFVASAVLGVVILALDTVLRTGAPPHYYVLIVFVIIDFFLGALAFPMPKSVLMRLAIVWSVLRILIQLGDVYLGPMYQFSYGQFADYLFNPDSSCSNRPGTPHRHRSSLHRSQGLAKKMRNYRRILNC
jgi:hypothetical protein